MGRSLPVAALTLFVASATGCQSIARFPGIDPTDYAHTSYKGDFTQVYQYSVPQVESAALEALADLGFHDISRRIKDENVILKAKTLDHRPAKVTIRPRNRMSAMTVRIGFGDEMASDALVQRVALNFGTIPRTLIPLEPTLSRRDDPPPPPRRILVIPSEPIFPDPLPPASIEETPPPLPPAEVGPFRPIEAIPASNVPSNWT